MKKARLILSASLLTIAAFSAVTFSSCTKDDKECNVGYEGKDCDQEVRTKYYNTYKGDGSTNDGLTYTNWGLKFSSGGTDATKMHANLMDENDAPAVAFDVNLTTNTSFRVIEFTSAAGNSYSGSGQITATTATLTLTEVESGVTTIYTFPSMVK